MSPSRASGQQDFAQILPIQGPVARLTSLRRTIRIFDFEEAQGRPVEFPDHFYRRSPRDGALAEGFRPFGTISLDSEQAYSGSWSFRFDLNGGSLAARTFEGTLPILPYADYAIRARVRTRGLNHARARLVAWLIDRHGNPIDASRTESALTRTPDQWETIAVDVYGEYEDAADLMVELQVLQPDQFIAAGTGLDEPRIDDFSGSVWFDDLRVMHLPRIELDPIGEGIITTLPRQPELQLLVRDLASEPIVSRLQVFDLDGNTVFDETYGPARGQQRHTVTIGVDRPGWYRAVLDVHSGPQLIGRHWLDFMVLGESRARRPANRNRFGVVLADPDTSRLEAVAALVRSLEIGQVVLPIWTRHFSESGQVERMRRISAVVGDFLRSDLELTLSLNEIPDELARAVGLDHDQVLDLFHEDPETWKPYLEELLVAYGLDIRRWQIGNIKSLSLMTRPDVAARARDAERALEHYIADADLYVPWAAEYALDPGQSFGAVHVAIPFEIPPPAIEHYVDRLFRDAEQVAVTLQPLPMNRFSPRQQAADLMHRALYAWRSSAVSLNLLAPWSWQSGPHDRLQIQPAFGVWHTLADRLSDREFVDELTTDPYVHAWILRGRSPDDAAIVLWTDRAAPYEATPMRIFLGHAPVHTIDAFGQSSEIPLEDGLHTLRPTELPQFVEGINLGLVRFRASFAIEPALIPAVNRMSELKFRLLNPWDNTISGKLTLTDTNGLDLSPHTVPFTIRPGVTASIPVMVQVGRNVLAGPVAIRATATFNADRDYAIQMVARTEVGLPDVAFAASWGLAQNVITGARELIIIHTVTNQGDRVLDLDVYVMTPERSVRRRPLPPLGPGETAVRMFNLGPTATVSGPRRLRVGVEMRDRSIRLNRQLTIPAFTPLTATAAATPP